MKWLVLVKLYQLNTVLITNTCDCLTFFPVQQQHMVAQQVRAANNRSTTPKARNTSTPGLQQQHTSQRAQRTATPNHTVQQQMVSPGAGKLQFRQRIEIYSIFSKQKINLNSFPGQQIQMTMQQQVHLQHQQAQNQHQPQQVHQQQSLDVQQIDQYNNHLSGAPVHGHHQVMHQQHDYLGVPQMGSAQNYPAQSPNSYGTLPMTSVIQHRMSGNHSNLTTHNPLPSPHQRLGPSPSSCSVGSSFYGQSPNVPPGKHNNDHLC